MTSCTPNAPKKIDQSSITMHMFRPIRSLDSGWRFYLTCRVSDVRSCQNLHNWKLLPSPFCSHDTVDTRPCCSFLHVLSFLHLTEGKKSYDVGQISLQQNRQLTLAVDDVSYSIAYKVMLAIKANRFLTLFLVNLLFSLEGNTDSCFLFFIFKMHAWLITLTLLCLGATS